MRIEISSFDGRQHIIDTSDPELAARWFADRAPYLLNVNAALPSAEIRVIPAEGERLPHTSRWFSEDGLRALAEEITTVADRLKVRRETGQV
ncbi:MAG: hypothetical protein ACYCVZ_17110 [Streptosporangiaceae bacterium]